MIFNDKFFTIFFLFTNSILLSQNINISGIITNLDDNSPIPYSNITFINKEDNNKIYEGLADEKGKFNVRITPGIYDITIEQAGFDFYSEERSLSEDTYLGKLLLEYIGEEKNIDAIVIEGSRPIYKVEMDKKIYDVTQDLTAKGGTLSDVMQNVPSLSVDVDGTVSLRGNDNVTILIDGKPSAMLGINDTGEALKMISADIVERIEVVTNASARYEAAGTAGIVNIITKKNKKPGITGSLEAIGGSPQLYGTNLNLGYDREKFSWFANAGLRYSKNEGDNSNRYSRSDASGVETALSLQNGKRERERTNFNFNTGLNFNFDDYNSLTTSIGYRVNTRNNLNLTQYYDFLPALGFSQREERQHNNGYGIDGNLNFTHNFQKEGNTLTIDGNFNYTIDDDDSDIYDKNFQKSLNYNTRNGFMLKSDYVLPFNENSQLEAGVRADYLKIKTDFSLDEMSYGATSWINNPDYTDQTNYEQNILSAYIQYGNKWGDFSFLAGLREETSYIKVHSDKESTSINKNYTDLFPTLHLNYELSEKSQIQASYSRRINRPRNRMLIPYKNLSDDRNTFQGNPDLDPSYTDSYELSFNFQAGAINIIPSAYYQKTKDPFQRVTIPDSEGRLNTRPINLGHEDRYGGEISYSIRPYPWWRIFGEFNFFQYENHGTHTYEIPNPGIGSTIITEDLSKSGFSWRTKLNLTIKLPDLFNFQLQGNYMAPRKTGQNKIKELYGMNIGISKDILDGQGTIIFNIQDVLNSRTRKTETFGNDFYRYSESQWRPRQFTLSFTYRFNKDIKNNKKNRSQDNYSDFDNMEI